MKSTKRVDCVRMKERIQSRLDRDYRGLTEREIRHRMRAKLLRATGPIGRLWRSKGAMSNQGDLETAKAVERDE